MSLRSQHHLVSFLERFRPASGATGPVSTADLARAARLLTVRSRREATGLFAGNYVSAFRGGGLEFEESRPYVPGDDLSMLDRNATARTGNLFVKRYREERNQTLIFALDSSASMHFGTTGRTKIATAVQALALLTASAGRAGDRTGLISFSASGPIIVPAGRGRSHGMRVIRAAVNVAQTPAGATRLAPMIRTLRSGERRRAIMIVFSDFRDPMLLPYGTGYASLRGELADLARRHDLIAAVVTDPVEEELPRVGPLRVGEPDGRGATHVIDTRSESTRRRYRIEAEAWRRRVDQEVRGSGAEIVRLRTDHDPLHALGHFFRERAARRATA